MSINDPQWGNSHRPDQKDPDQVPDKTGTEPVQPEDGKQDRQITQTPGQPPKSSPPEGPPDLEELWQQLVYKTRCHMARLLGREVPAPPEPSTQALVPADTNDVAPLAGWQALSFKSWMIGVSLIVGAWLVSGFYLVDTQQRGVLSRFGRIVIIEDPGWHWRWPYPIDSVRLINVTSDRTLEVGMSAQKGQRQSQGLMLTSDGSLVGIAYAVVYQVTDPVAYLSRAGEPADLLALLAETSLRDMVATQTLTTLQAAGNKQNAVLSEPILKVARTALQTAVDPLQLGIVIKGLEIREVQLPAPVTQSIKATEREEQARAKALRDAQAASTESLIKARKLAMALQDESTAYVRVLEFERQIMQAGNDTVDAAQAQKALADKAGQWRKQYPLVFANVTTLQERISQPARTDRTLTNVPDAAKPSDAPVPGGDAWRDRDLMRSRDRVDRPGNGS